jgi:hypothetical protein
LGPFDIQNQISRMTTRAWLASPPGRMPGRDAGYWNFSNC